MYDMIAACSVGYTKEKLCIDLNQMEQNMGGAFMPVVARANTEEIVFMQIDSRMSLDSLETALKQAVEGCKLVRGYLESAVRTYMSSC